MSTDDSRPDIWRLQAQFDTDGLIQALESDEANIRKRAAAALRAMGASSSVPSLRAALSNEEDPDTRATMVAALDTLAETEVGISTEEDTASAEQTQVNRLIEQLKSSNPDQIVDAAQKLGEIEDKMAVEPLVVVFNNAKLSIQVRLAVAEALLQLDSAPVEVSLLAALRHSDWHIRRNGAAILGQLKAIWAVEPLSRALRDSNQIVRRTARAALQRIGTPEALELLKRYGKSATQTNAAVQQNSPTDSTDLEGESGTAQRGGLLQRFGGQKDDDKVEDPNAPPPAYLAPTAPLDPRVVETIEKQRKAREAAKSAEVDVPADEPTSQVDASNTTPQDTQAPPDNSTDNAQ